MLKRLKDLNTDNNSPLPQDKKLTILFALKQVVLARKVTKLSLIFVVMLIEKKNK